jgi:hypothetical protein
MLVYNFMTTTTNVCGRTQKNHENLRSTAGVPAEIRTKHISNTEYYL